jgi:predicted transcriptional regulator
MSETLLEMTKDLVLAQIRAQQITPDNLAHALGLTHQTLRQLHSLEATSTERPEQGLHPGATPERTISWKSSITRHTVTCLECGETFKQLSMRHLQQHELDPQSYRRKYGIPRRQPLSAREVTARRQQLARDIRPWEQARAAKLAPKQAEKDSNGTVDAWAKTAPAAAGRRKRAKTKA